VGFEEEEEEEEEEFGGEGGEPRWRCVTPPIEM